MSDRSETDRIPTSEVCRRAGVSRLQLHRWASQNLLDRPEVVSAPSGRGRVGMWPVSVLGQIEQIKGHVKRGKPLTDVYRDVLRQRGEGEGAEKLAKAWADEVVAEFNRSRSIRRGTLSLPKGMRGPLREVYEALIEAHLRNIGLSKVRSLSAARKAVDDEVLRGTFQMLKLGMSPVLVVLGDGKVGVYPDFIVSALSSVPLLSASAVHGVAADGIRSIAGFVVVPLGFLLSITWSHWKPRAHFALPDPEYVPAFAAERQVGGVVMRVPVHPRRVGDSLLFEVYPWEAGPMPSHPEIQKDINAIFKGQRSAKSKK